jgi:tRNA(Ile2) C34 agmatinyltransferase TiaS
MKPYQINAEHRLAAEGNFPSGRKIPEWLIEKIAVEKDTGGYSDKHNPICPNCRVRMSNSDVCFCQ